MLETLFDQVVRSSWLGSAAIVLILIVRWVGGHRIAPSIRCALWVPAALLLIAPQLPDLGLLQPPKPVLMKRVTIRSTAEGSAPITVQTVTPLLDLKEEPSLAVQQPSSPSLNLAALWAAGSILALTWWGLSFIVLHRRVRRMAEPLPDGLADTLAGCARAMNLRSVPRLIATRSIRAPAVMGFLRPVLLVPPSITATLETEELRMVLMHECAHVKRRDLIGHGLSVLVLALHWFNPLCWLAMRLLRADREAACDAAVLAASEVDRRSLYGHTLLKLGSASVPAMRFQALVGVLGSVDMLRKRIVEIASFGSSSVKAGRFALALALLAGAGLAMAAAEPPKLKSTFTKWDEASPPALKPPAEPALLPGATPPPPALPPSSELLQRAYKVPPNFLLLAVTNEPVKDPFAPKNYPQDPFAPQSSPQPAKPTAKELLEKKGVTFPEGATAVFNPATSLLIARNTIDNLERIRKIVEKTMEPQLQVHVRALMAVFGEKMHGRPADLAEFMSIIANGNHLQGASFQQRQEELKTKGDAGGRAFAVQLSDAQFQQALRLLSKTVNADEAGLTGRTQEVVSHITNLISLPSTTHRSGGQGRIETVREFYFPTEYGLSPGKNGVATPTAFEMEALGVMIDTVPSLHDNKPPIDFHFKPTMAGLAELREFKADSGDKVSLPLFQTTSKTGHATLSDGDTVAILMQDAALPAFMTSPPDGRSSAVMSNDGKAVEAVEAVKSKFSPVILFLTTKLIDPSGKTLKKGG